MAKELFTIENGVKLSILSLFCWGIISGINDVKTEIALIKQAKQFEVSDLQRQVNDLKYCCNNRREERRVNYIDRSAIVPNSVELMDDNNNN